MIIGASTLGAELIELAEIMDSVELYLPKLGIYEKGTISKECVEELIDLLSTHKIKTSIHAPYFSDSTNYPRDLVVDTTQMQKHHFKLMEEAINLSDHIESKVVVIHPGRIIENREESLGSMIENLKQLASYAEDHGVMLGLENKEGTNPENLCTTPEEIIRVIKEVGSENLAITFDIGHANLTCKGDQKKLATFTEKLRERIVHIHIHDNMGENTTQYHGDTHSAIGTGCIDFNILHKIKYNGIYNLEMFSTEEIRKSRKLLKNYLI